VRREALAELTLSEGSKPVTPLFLCGSMEAEKAKEQEDALCNVLTAAEGVLQCAVLL